MSTDYTTYVVYGIKLEYNGDLQDYLYDNDLEGSIDIINDFICGEYTVIGKILSTHDKYDCPKFTEISVDGLNHYKEEYKVKFKEIFPEKFHYYVNDEFKLLSFVHVS
jgi:hypothetical protein